MDPRGHGIDAPLPIHRRIVQRREELALAAYELARRVGISPSYMSMIEMGKKVPTETVAVRIAEALEDDPELYRAWAHASRLEDLEGTLDRLKQVSIYRSSPEIRKKIARGEDLSAPVRQRFGLDEDVLQDARELLRESRHDTKLSSDNDSIVPVPLLAVDVDPGPDPPRSGSVADRVNVDRRMLPEESGSLFAYRPSPRMVRRVGKLIRADDLVVLDANVGRVAPERVYAVRFRNEVLFSRVLFKGKSLLLLPSEGSSDFEVIDLDGTDALRRVLVGIVVATMRVWGTEPDRPSEAGLLEASDPNETVVRALSLGAKARGWRGAGLFSLPKRRSRDRWRLEEGRFLVRDCEWKRKYGWRPLQRPEDLDFLDAHPGTAIRFRLLRGGKVRYYLEMTPDEWRQALAGYDQGASWRRNGYIVAITRRRSGQYSEEFQDRWAAFVREPD